MASACRGFARVNNGGVTSPLQVPVMALFFRVFLERKNAPGFGFFSKPGTGVATYLACRTAVYTLPDFTSHRSFSTSRVECVHVVPTRPKPALNIQPCAQRDKHVFFFRSRSCLRPNHSLLLSWLCLDPRNAGAPPLANRSAFISVSDPLVLRRSLSSSYNHGGRGFDERASGGDAQEAHLPQVYLQGRRPRQAPGPLHGGGQERM